MQKNDFHADHVPAILQGSGLFKGVDVASIDSELQDSRVQRIEPGHILLDPKHINTAIYIVLHGELKDWFDARQLSAHISVTDETDYAASFCVVEHR